MRIGPKLSLGFLAMAGLFGTAAYLAGATNDAIRAEVGRIRGSSIRELTGATAMVSALESTQLAAQELIAEAWQARAGNASLDARSGRAAAIIHQIDVGLDRFDEELAASRRATEAALALAEQSGDARRADAERRELAQQLDRLEDEIHVHRTMMGKLTRLAGADPAAATRFLEAEVEPHYVETMSPAIDAYQRDAEEEVADGLAAVEAALARADRTNAGATAAALIAAAGLGIWIARSISRPIATLRDAAFEIGEGDLDIHVSDDSSDEIGALARAFNEMAGRLRATTVSKSWVDDIIRSMGEILIVTDVDGRVRTVNRAALEQLGWREEELVGRCVDDLLLDPRDSGELSLKTRDGNAIPVVCTPTDLFDEIGRPRGRVLVARDVRAQRETEEELRRSLAEKEVLLREIHHRVKNNLQVVCSLLRLQANESSSTDAARLLRESESRVRSMALIHEQLYRSSDLAHIDFRAHVEGLARSVLASSGSAGRPVSLDIRVDPVALDLDVAIPCGLILNELLSNALEHAFPGDRAGTVRVGFHVADGRATLSVEDDGVGMPSLYGDPKQRPSLGLKLVAALTQQLGGESGFEVADGTRFHLTFEMPGEAARGA